MQNHNGGGSPKPSRLIILPPEVTPVITHSCCAFMACDRRLGIFGSGSSVESAKATLLMAYRAKFGTNGEK